MRGRFVQLHGGKGNGDYVFDRKYLVEGYTGNGRYIPEGGVLLQNGTLAGYLSNQSGGSNWRIVGTVNRQDPNVGYIPEHQQAGTGRSPATKTKINRTGSPNSRQNRPVSLKSAVKMLREYYRNNFN
jgi:hypothetical protein